MDIDKTRRDLAKVLKQIKKTNALKEAVLKEKISEMPEDKKVVMKNLQKDIKAILDSKVDNKEEMLNELNKKYEKWV